MDKRWAIPPACRTQQVLYPVMLDEIVPPNAPIRLLHALLSGLDWTPWERHYHGHRGQPPIHPMLLAGCILYGLLRGIRSSRELEEATRIRIDYIWFLEGRTVDHSTFSQFRTHFAAELTDLNRQIARKLHELTREVFATLFLDGTRLRANSDRHGARTAEALERTIAAIASELDRKLAEMVRADLEQDLSLPPVPEQMDALTPDGQAAAGDGCADAVTPESQTAAGEIPAPPLANTAKTPEELASLHREIERLERKKRTLETALETAKARDARKQKHSGKKAKPVRVPLTDPESQIQPNKEGGFAPNYTPSVAVAGGTGAIVCTDVASGGEEDPIALPALEEAQAIFGALPSHVVADGKVLRGETVETLAARDVSVLAPLGTDFSASNPANRPDPEQPVPEAQCAKLPKSGDKFSQAAFLYDAQEDCYHCPAGRTLTPQGNGRVNESEIFVQKYVCPGREGCPYAKDCLGEKTRERTVARDQYQEARDEVGRRMATAEGQALYAQRAPAVEVVFARIKGQMGIRGFLLRGLEKVRGEWSWVCASYNLKLLLGALGKGPGKDAQNAGGSAFPEEIRLLAFPGRVLGRGLEGLPQAA